MMNDKTHLTEWNRLLDGSTVALYESLLTKIENMRKAGQDIYPSQKNIMRSIASLAPQNVKCVILGQDPYHEPNQAMGLSFSVPDGVKLPPSLRNIFKELSTDLQVAIPQSGNLSPWTRQGVLLLNTLLTVEAHKARSHKKLGWQTVTSAIIKTTLTLPQPTVYLCWGKQAEDVMDKLIQTTDIQKPYSIIRSTHPSPLSANNRKSDVPAFMGSRPFSQANAFLEKYGVEPIDWAL